MNSKKSRGNLVHCHGFFAVHFNQTKALQMKKRQVLPRVSRAKLVVFSLVFSSLRFFSSLIKHHETAPKQKAQDGGSKPCLFPGFW